MKINTIAKVLTVMLFVAFLAGTAQLMTGCKPSSGDYGVFDLRSDNPEVPAGTQITASLAGKVVDSATKTGQAGINISLYSTVPALLNKMNSTPDGSFLFKGAAPGTYLLEAAAGSAQFDTATYTVLVNSDGTILPTNISLAVYPKGFSAEKLVDIHGQVTAATSTTAIIPKADVTVELFKVVDTVKQSPAIATAYTQAKGLFLFPQHKPGVYKIKVTAKNGVASDTYDIVINDKGESVPEIPLELILRD